jgi:hypothetical protein
MLTKTLSLHKRVYLPMNKSVSVIAISEIKNLNQIA